MRTRGDFVRQFAKELAERFPVLEIPTLKKLITEWQHSNLILAGDNIASELKPFLVALMQHRSAILGTPNSLRLQPDAAVNQAYKLLEDHINAVAAQFGAPEVLLLPLKVSDFARRVLIELDKLPLEDIAVLPEIVYVESKLSVAALQALMMKYANDQAPLNIWNMDFLNELRLLCMFRQLRIQDLAPEKYPHTNANKLFRFLENCYLDAITVFTKNVDNLLNPVNFIVRDMRGLEEAAAQKAAWLARPFSLEIAALMKRIKDYLCWKAEAEQRVITQHTYNPDNELLLEMSYVFADMFSCLPRAEWQACVDKLTLPALYMLLANGKTNAHFKSTDDTDAFFKEMGADILASVQFTTDQNKNDALIFLIYILASKRLALSEWRSNSAAELITSIFSSTPTRGERLAVVHEVINYIAADRPLASFSQTAENSSSPLHKHRKTLRTSGGSGTLSSDTFDNLLSLIPKAIVKPSSVVVPQQGADLALRKRAFQ